MVYLLTYNSVESSLLAFLRQIEVFMLFTYKFLSSNFTKKHILTDKGGDLREFQLVRSKKSFNVTISDTGSYLDIWVVSKTSSNLSVYTVLRKLGIVVQDESVVLLPEGYTKCTLLDGEAIVHCTYDKLFSLADTLGIRRRVFKNSSDCSVNATESHTSEL